MRKMNLRRKPYSLPALNNTTNKAEATHRPFLFLRTHHCPLKVYLVHECPFRDGPNSDCGHDFYMCKTQMSAQQKASSYPPDPKKGLWETSSGSPHRGQCSQLLNQTVLSPLFYLICLMNSSLKTSSFRIILQLSLPPRQKEASLLRVPQHSLHAPFIPAPPITDCPHKQVGIKSVPTLEGGCESRDLIKLEPL